MIIRSFKKSDYAQWLPLWQDNCLHQISDEITANTWKQLTTPNDSVHSLGIFDEQNALKGFLHYILHPITGALEPACYMQDLYVAPPARRMGNAKRLLWELHDMGKTQKWSRIYWFADNNNLASQNLYKTLGIKMDFSLHMLQTAQ